MAYTLVYVIIFLYLCGDFCAKQKILTVHRK